MRPIVHLVASADRGGAERYVAYAIEALPGRPHAVVALADGPMVEAWRRAGARVEVVAAGRGIAAAAAVGRIARAVRALDPEVVVCHATKANLFGAAAVRAAGIRRVVAVFHGGPGQYAYARALPAALYACAERISAGLVERAIAVCAATRDEVVSWGVPAGRVAVVETGVPDPGEAPLARLDPPRVVFLGRLSPEKGADLLAPVAARVAALRPGRSRFVVAGDGPMRARVEAALGEVYDASFRGEVGETEAAALLRSSSIAFLPSRAEGLPLVLLEAMSHGLAVVAAGVGGIPDALGGSGVVVPPDDPDAAAKAILRLLDDPAERRRLGAAARARFLERFTLEAFAPRLAAALGIAGRTRAGDVAAVVVAHGPAAPVGRALAAVRAALGARLAEAVVVDNASPEDPAPATAAAGARLVRLPENAGYAAGAAAGAAASSAPCLLFLNPDAEPVPGGWPEWVDRFLADESAAAQAPRVVAADGTDVASVYAFPTALRAFAEASGLSALRRLLLGPRPAPARRSACDYAQGSCLLLRRADWEGVGPFDPAYFLYHEEMDWARRALDETGRRVVFDPGVVCRHDGGVEVPPGREPLYWSGLARYARGRMGRRAAAVRLAIRAGLALSWPVHAVASLASDRARARAAGVLRALGESAGW